MVAAKTISRKFWSGLMIPDLYANNNDPATKNVKDTASKTIPGNIVSKLNEIKPIKKPWPAEYINHVLGALYGFGLTIQPIKGK